MFENVWSKYGDKRRFHSGWFGRVLHPYIFMISLVWYLMQARKGSHFCCTTVSLIHGKSPFPFSIVSIIVRSLQGGDQILPVGAQGVAFAAEWKIMWLMDQVLQQLVVYISVKPYESWDMLPIYWWFQSAITFNSSQAPNTDPKLIIQ